MANEVSVFASRLTATKTRHNDPHAEYTLKLTGREVFDLQNTLETVAIDAEDYMLTRSSVLLAEIIRLQIADQHGGQP